MQAIGYEYENTQKTNFISEKDPPSSLSLTRTRTHTHTHTHTRPWLWKYRAEKIKSDTSKLLPPPRERQRQTDTDRQTDRQTDRHTHTHTHTQENTSRCAHPNWLTFFTFFLLRPSLFFSPSKDGDDRRLSSFPGRDLLLLLFTEFCTPAQNVTGKYFARINLLLLLFTEFCTPAQNVRGTSPGQIVPNLSFGFREGMAESKTAAYFALRYSTVQDYRPTYLLSREQYRRKSLPISVWPFCCCCCCLFVLFVFVVLFCICILIAFVRFVYNKFCE